MLKEAPLFGYEASAAQPSARQRDPPIAVALVALVPS